MAKDGDIKTNNSTTHHFNGLISSVMVYSRALSAEEIAHERRNKMELDLDNIYKYHSPKPGQAEKYEAIREKAKELAELIDSLCPDSREKSVAFTEIETAVMWANASIARNGIFCMYCGAEIEVTNGAFSGSVITDRDPNFSKPVPGGVMVGKKLGYSCAVCDVARWEKARQDKEGSSI